MSWQPATGAIHEGGVTRFRVWAPEAESIELMLEGEGPRAMERGADGYWSTAAAVGVGGRYRYRVNGEGPFPDPASRYQPLGVHGPSEIVDRAFPWTDGGWRGVARSRLVIYELHVGAFTAEGTFAAAAERLPYLRDLGVTAVELMPVADFPGERNWGYDGVSPFAPARCYGRPDELKRFVDRAHREGLAVFLDVVYNHFGPDGAYQGVYSKDYYSRRHRSPWGAGINYDGAGCEAVRRYAIENAQHWVEDFHMDGLRLDATHAILDDSAPHLLAELAEAVHGCGRLVHVFAEDDRNRRTLMTEYGLDGVWADDFHHHTRVRLAGDHDGYFADFDGRAESLARTLRDGWFYSGQHSEYRGGARGTSAEGLEKDRFVICIQNHDQIGNRAFGERLHHQVSDGAWRAASAMLLLAPETPLLFMGQEWGASSPFQYFTDHHEDLGRKVTAGRRREFQRFRAFADPALREKIPDPQSADTFLRSKLRWEELEQGPHASLVSYYRALLGVRRRLSAPLAPRVLDEDTIALEGDVTAVIRLAGAGAAPVREADEAVLVASEDGIRAGKGRVLFPGPGAVVLGRG
ncbi:MAG: malto-oligosyltrehalose trehalohydrolase [Bryobacteraceae bacterium]